MEAVGEERVEVLVADPGVDGDDLQGRRPVAETRAAGVRADRCPDGGNGETARIENDGVAPVHRADGAVELRPAAAIRCRVKPAARREPPGKVLRGGLPDPPRDPPDRVPVEVLLVHHSNSRTLLAWSAPISTMSVVENSSWTSVIWDMRRIWGK